MKLYVSLQKSSLLWSLSTRKYIVTLFIYFIIFTQKRIFCPLALIFSYSLSSISLKSMSAFCSFIRNYRSALKVMVTWQQFRVRCDQFIVIVRVFISTLLECLYFCACVLSFSTWIVLTNVYWGDWLINSWRRVWNYSRWSRNRDRLLRYSF